MNPEIAKGMQDLTRQANAAGPESKQLDPEAIVALISQILAANEELQHRLATAELDLQRRAEQAASYLCQSRTDELTGLPNRRVFNDELARSLAGWRDCGIPFSLVLADIDRFKSVNDSFGHLAGDTVLADVARALQAAVRANDVVARFGGEEFALLLPNTDAAGAQQVAERVRQLVETARFVFDSALISVTVSCGATIVLQGDDAETLLKRCDAALYAAKHEGRNMSYWHSGEHLSRVGAGPTAEIAPSTGLKLSIIDQACQDLRRRLLEVIRLEREAGV